MFLLYLLYRTFWTYVYTEESEIYKWHILLQESRFAPAIETIRIVFIGFVLYYVCICRRYMVVLNSIVLCNSLKYTATFTIISVNQIKYSSVILFLVTNFPHFLDDRVSLSATLNYLHITKLSLEQCFHYYAHNFNTEIMWLMCLF